VFKILLAISLAEISKHIYYELSWNDANSSLDSDRASWTLTSSTGSTTPSQSDACLPIWYVPDTFFSMGALSSIIWSCKPAICTIPSSSTWNLCDRQSGLNYMVKQVIGLSIKLVVPLLKWQYYGTLSQMMHTLVRSVSQKATIVIRLSHLPRITI
jgi:hypothetical protein